jgi:hypothetical protein
MLSSNLPLHTTSSRHPEASCGFPCSMLKVDHCTSLVPPMAMSSRMVRIVGSPFSSSLEGNTVLWNSERLVSYSTLYVVYILRLVVLITEREHGES